MLIRGLSEGKVMGKFQVVVWCEACQGDEEGCFGGAVQVLPGVFGSREDAEKAGAHYCADLPYRYRVEPTPGMHVASASAEIREPLSASGALVF